MEWYYVIGIIWNIWSKNKIFSGWKQATHDWYNKPETNSGHFWKSNRKGSSLEETVSLFHTQSWIFWISGVFFLLFFLLMDAIIDAHASNLDPKLIHSPVINLMINIICNSPPQALIL